MPISGLAEYPAAIAALDRLFIKPKNETFARYCLLSRTQQDGESLDQYMIVLRALAKDCNFQQVSDIVHCEQSIRTAFISGIKSGQIRQRLLEDTKTLEQTFEAALTLESAFTNSERYHRFGQHSGLSTSAAMSDFNANYSSADLGYTSDQNKTQDTSLLASTMNMNISRKSNSNNNKCPWCGYDSHPRTICPARDAQCLSCEKKGHWAKVCRSRPKNFNDNGGDRSSKPAKSYSSHNFNNMYPPDVQNNSESYLAAISSQTPRYFPHNANNMYRTLDVQNNSGSYLSAMSSTVLLTRHHQLQRPKYLYAVLRGK